MSKAEIECLVKLLEAWDRDGATIEEQDDLLKFLAVYRRPLVNALRFYAADK